MYCNYNDTYYAYIIGTYIIHLYIIHTYSNYPEVNLRSVHTFQANVQEIPLSMIMNATVQKTQFNTELRYKLSGHANAPMLREKRKQTHPFIYSFKIYLGPSNC